MVNDILVIKRNVIRKPKQMKDLQESINKQKETGTVILPWYCDALFVPKDMLIKIIEGGSGYAVEKEDMHD